MIAYGYEQPVAITPTEIFNPTTANMVLQSMGTYANALREDYKDAVAKQEEFMKEYGLFTSPISSDADYYYDKTIGGLSRLFDEADKQGVDLLRSQQGRAIIQKYIMSRPYGDLSRIRESAENANAYKQAYGKMLAEGLVSPEMAKTMDGDMSTWNTMSQGVWDKTAPVRYQSYADLVEQLRKNLKDEYRLIGKRGMYDVFGVSKDRINQVLTEGIEDILTKPQAQYYLDNVFGGDKLSFRNKLYDVLENQLGEEEKINEERKVRYQEDRADRRATLAAGAKNNKDKDKGTNSYRENVWLSAMGTLGVSTPEDLTKLANKHAYDSVKDIVVYSAEQKKNVKFSELSDKEKAQLINKENGHVSKKIKEAYDNFFEAKQREIMTTYTKNGGYTRTSALSRAFADSPVRFASQFGDDDMAYDSNGKITGFNASGKQFYTIGEITARTGIFNKFNARKFDANDVDRANIDYFTIPTQSNGKEMIVQYEKTGGHRHHAYRVVNAHMKDGTVKQMWMETFDPQDYLSDSAQTHDMLALKAAGQGTGTIDTPLQTVYE